MENKKISFTIDKIVFKSDNDFKIAKAIPFNDSYGLNTNKFNQISIKGEMNISEFCDYEAIIVNEENNKYGTTYTVSTVVPYGLSNGVSNDEQMIIFLSNYASKSMGEKCNVKGIYDMVFNKDRGKLLEIYGIGEKTVNKIFHIWDKYGFEIAYSTTLLGWGFKDKHIDKLREYFGNLDLAIKSISEDIYEALYLGLDIRIDYLNAIANTLGYDECDKRRIKAQIFNDIKQLAYKDYKSYIDTQDFFQINNINLLLNTLGVDFIKECFDELTNEERIIRIKNDDYDIVGLYERYKIEMNIIKEINRITEFNIDTSNINFDEEIKKEEEICGFTFTDKQKEAIVSGVSATFIEILGSAGAGKTSISKAVLNITERNMPLNLVQMALSGKASRVLSNTNGRYSSTIAKATIKGEKFNANVVLIDEVSMVDIDTFLRILKLVPNGCKVITMGDNKQLPSLFIGKMIDDLKLFKNIKVVELKEVHRQALNSGIIVFANDLINGKYPIEKEGNFTLGELKDMHVDTLGKRMDKAVNKSIELYKNKGLNDTQIVCATNNLCYLANVNIQKGLKVNKGNFIEVTAKANKIDGKVPKYKIYVGDKIKITKNNYKIPFSNDYEMGVIDGINALYNGEMGIVSYVDKEKEYINILVGNDEFSIDCDNFDMITLGYVATCHSLQGSGVDNIVIFTNGTYAEKKMMLSNEWLYTAVTRAKKECWCYISLEEIKLCTEIRANNKKVTFIEKLMQDEFRTKCD